MKFMMPSSKLVHSLEPHVVVSKNRNPVAAVESCGCEGHHGHGHDQNPHPAAVHSAQHSPAEALGEMDKRQKLELITAIGLFLLGFVFPGGTPG